MNKLPFLILFAVLFSVSCCTRRHEQRDVKAQKKAVHEPLIEANKESVNIESDQIESYISRRGWKMINTGTGLRYMIYQKGMGDTAKTGKTAIINYEVSLIDGTVCYSSKELGKREFIVGMADVESGLHEGITYMRVGDKAKMILPSHLAHGLLGDRKKIPAKATIIYDVELLALK